MLGQSELIISLGVGWIGGFAQPATYWGLRREVPVYNYVRHAAEQLEELCPGPPGMGEKG